MLYIIELFLYATYLYVLMIVGINVKPSILSTIILFLYCFYTTWHLYVGCNSKLLKNKLIKGTFVTGYSLFCVTAYYLLYYTWDKYNENMLYIIYLLGVPLYYFTAVKIAEYVFECDKYHTLFFPFKFSHKNINLILSYLD